MISLSDKLFWVAIVLPMGVIVFLVGEIITLPLKMLKILSWDYLDYICYMADDKADGHILTFYWTQEEFYKIQFRESFESFYLDVIMSFIPKFSGDVYLTIDENPDNRFDCVIMTPGTIKTNLWAWHIHKDKILCELKQKRVAIKEQKMMEDF